MTPEPELLAVCRLKLGYTPKGLAHWLCDRDDRRIRRWEQGAVPIPSLMWITMLYMLRRARELTPREIPDHLIDQVEQVIRRRRP